MIDMFTIKNEFLTVSLNSLGAEIASLKDNETQKEYIWQGNPAIWSGQAPLLFPITGRLLNDTYIYHEKTYSLPKHGFARKSEFSLMRSKPNLAVFGLFDNEKTREAYPFRFYLGGEYKLEGKKLIVTYTIQNKDEVTRYFSFGAHPAFNIELGSRVVFAEKENLTTLLTNSYGYVTGEKTLNENGDTIVVDAHIFDGDALFFPSLKSESAKLVTPEGKDVLRMTYGRVPYLGLWAKPGAPYVCIEPWYGICDSENVSGKLEEKPAIVSLEPQREFVFTYEIEILE
jgi:galactose mutarotase-like enzyme